LRSRQRNLVLATRVCIQTKRKARLLLNGEIVRGGFVSCAMDSTERIGCTSQRTFKPFSGRSEEMLQCQPVTKERGERMDQ
jgi:hypothetical protein